MFSQHLRKSFKLFKNIYSNNHLLITNQFVNFRTSSTNHDSSLKRTHFCGKLGIENVNEIVTVCGWLQTIRYSNFIILRDLHGIVQINLDEEFFKENKKFSIESLTNESVLAIQGLVTNRPFGRENKQMKTGHIEIKAKKIEVLNEANNKLPFTISQFNRANEAIRLQYRYLDLRFSQMQQNLITRSNFVHKCRQFLAENNFIDIETPTLFRRTPGGAREFIVPTKTSQQFYSLTQSPQQFKQLLMIAGLDRYYQVARCYRDESTKPDRQPEFTQIDIEMSFIDQNDCIQLIESLIQNCWPLQLNDIKFPFKRMDYDEAMCSYGVDKPDLRFDMKFVNMTNFFKKKSNMKQETGVLKLDSLISDDKFSIYAFKVSSEYGINEIDIDKIEKEFKNIIKNVTNNNSTDLKHLFFILKNQSTGNNIAKYLKSETRNEIETFLQVDCNELVILMASNNEQKMQEILGKYRLRLADLLDEVNLLKFGSNSKLLRDPKVFNFLWVVNFPLFTLNEETNKLESTHHPFTAPINEHLNLVKESKDLDKVIGQHYDLVLNGEEIAGGSIRIHNSKLQRHVLENILNEHTDQLEHLLKALEFGAPPHGGIALGLDRLCGIICGTTNIRDVIAFPKSQNGKDLMALAPANVPKEDLDYYRIKCLD